jgi:hypothetical protein
MMMKLISITKITIPSNMFELTIRLTCKYYLSHLRSCMNRCQSSKRGGIICECSSMKAHNFMKSDAYYINQIRTIIELLLGSSLKLSYFMWSISRSLFL